MNMKKFTALVIAFAVMLTTIGLQKNNETSAVAADSYAADTLYASEIECLTVKEGRYFYPEQTTYVSGRYYNPGNSTNSIYLKFQYNGVDVTDPNKLTAYLDNYDPETDAEVYTKVGSESLKIEKIYPDSSIMKITYTGGSIEFSNEYAITYDGATPNQDNSKNIQVAFGPAFLHELNVYKSNIISDETQAREIETDGTSDIDIYAASVDISDRVFWNTVNSAKLNKVSLIDENGNDISSVIKTDANATVTEVNGRKIIYSERITIPKENLAVSSKLELYFDIDATGGDGTKRQYTDSATVYIIHKEPAPSKSVNPLEVTVSSKTFSRTKNLTKKKTFTISVKNAEGNVTYTLSKSAKSAGIKVTKAGKVTVPKKCKKGTYTITVNAEGNSDYLAGKKTVTVKVKK